MVESQKIIKPCTRVAFKLAIFFSLFACVTSFAQQSFTLSGIVKDSTNQSVIVGAVVRALPSTAGILSDVNGAFSLKLMANDYQIVISYLGYKPDTVFLKLNSNKRLVVSLWPKNYNGKEIEIIGKIIESEYESSQIGKQVMTATQIKTLPSFMGEVDVMRSLTLLPGVKAAGDGNAGFYVRGGSPDQNMVMLDNATLYNPSHLLGFFSVFNGDVIDRFTLQKSGMSANYGGRLSSVLDVKTLGDLPFNQPELSIGLGNIAARLSCKTPLFKQKVNLVFAARRTYLDLLAKPILANTDNAGSSYFFNDYNSKLSWKISNKIDLSVTGFYGYDRLNFMDSGTRFNLDVPWGNRALSSKLRYKWSRNALLKVGAVWSKYDFEAALRQEGFGFVAKSGIETRSYMADFDYFVGDRHWIKVGFSLQQHKIEVTNATIVLGGESIAPNLLDDLGSTETAFYINDEFKLSPKLTVIYGIRQSFFTPKGAYEYKEFDSNRNITRQLTFAEGEKVITYKGLEPRLLWSYNFHKNNSIKGSITRNYQYLHRVSMASTSLPTDIWMPSSMYVKPQIGWQASIGYFKLLKYDLQFSSEIYYRKMLNQIEFRNGAIPTYNQNPEYDFIFGNGVAYGSEWMLRKNAGNLSGWISYTWAWSKRRFTDLNDNQFFPERYDRRHDIAITAQYKLSKKWHFSSVFVYATGAVFTVPETRYFIEGQLIPQFTYRNNYRMPAYHRLDISVNYYPKGQDRQHWNFSILNVYNRLNPYIIYFTSSGSAAQSNLQVKANSVAIFPIIPSISWNYKFVK